MFITYKNVELFRKPGKPSQDWYEKKYQVFC